MHRLRTFFLVTALVLVVLGIVFFRTIVQFYTDWLWYGEVGYKAVYLRTFAWDWGTRFVAIAVASVFLYFNLRLTKPGIAGILERYQDRLPAGLGWRWFHRAFLLFSLLVGLAFGAGLAPEWPTVAKFFQSVPFGTTDPLFHRDVGFFVFELPFLLMVARTLATLLLLSLAFSALVYGLSGGLRFEGIGLEWNRRPRVHFTLLAIGYALARAWGYRLDLYNLLVAPSPSLFGAGYTDVHVRVPILQLLSIAAAVVALLLVGQLFRPTGRWIVRTAGAWILLSILAGGIVPGIVQRWVVEPNELKREEPYLRRSIQFTRKAYGLDKMVEREFPASQAGLNPEIVRQNPDTLSNIRLWDWRPLQRTYGQLQEIRLYYDFLNVDVDRYQVNGKIRQVMLAARELSVDKIQNRTWINEHLQYTHGYGLVVSPVNEVTPEGLPVFWISNIPPKSSVGLNVTRPQIYFGEGTDRYAIVRTRLPEFDFPVGDQNASTVYQGTAGVRMSSPLVRAAFAARMGDLRMLISPEITSESRILFRREISNRIRHIAPFLRYDRDPYLILVGGRLMWLQDAYTVTDRYPYSQPIPEWGNYVRNSVKVLVDAYDGTVRFYAYDPSDPILMSYQRLFPGLFRPVAEMPDEVRQHVRYPEDLFLIQARILTAFHMRNPTVFYNREDLWDIPREIFEGNEQPVQPYYTILQLPGEKEPEFVLMLPFTPVRKDNMVAWMAVRSNAQNYGQLFLYKFPKQSLTYGPLQVEARIDQDSEISKELTLWNQRGSRVIRGNLLVIPIADTILYVEPLFLEAPQTELPELKRIVLASGPSVVMAESFDRAIGRLVKTDVDQVIQPGPFDQELRPDGVEGELSAQALRVFRQAQGALRGGDFASFGRHLKELERILEQLSAR